MNEIINILAQIKIAEYDLNIKKIEYKVFQMEDYKKRTEKDVRGYYKNDVLEKLVIGKEYYEYYKASKWLEYLINKLSISSYSIEENNSEYLDCVNKLPKLEDFNK